MTRPCFGLPTREDDLAAANLRACPSQFSRAIRRGDRLTTIVAASVGVNFASWANVRIPLACNRVSIAGPMPLMRWRSSADLADGWRIMATLVVENAPSPHYDWRRGLRLHRTPT